MGRIRRWLRGTLRADRFEADEVDAGSVSTESLNSTIIQKESESVQSAINRASTGDKILLQPGTYEENVNITTAEITVVGAGRGTVIDGGTTDFAINIKAPDVIVKDLAVKTTSGTGENLVALNITGGNPRCEVTSVWVLESDFHGLRTAADEARFISAHIESENVDEDDVLLISDNCIADDIIGTVNDSGVGNAVGETA